jgi:hypothetical protein
VNRGNVAAVACHAFDELVWITDLNAVWLLFTLLGGVVFGLAPAAVAASTLVRKRFSGEKVRLLAEFCTVYRREFGVYRARDAMRTAVNLRKDWLDKLGLEIPKTTDDLYEVAKAFTELDPDGNGVDDT